MPHTAPISADPVARLAERQHWITPEAEIAAQTAIRSVLGGDDAKGEKFREILHGSWLHEPLHAIMTDVPVGSWTAAVLFDSLAAMTGSRKLDSAADALVILGLAGAAGASITGMNDWSEIKRDAPRRIGAVHALLNVAATAFFAGSCYQRRKRGARSTARSLAVVGFLINSVSAHLGGNLIYEHGIGVERGKRWQD